MSGGYTSTRGLKTRLLGPTAESKEDIIKAVENVHDLTSAFKVMLRELSPPLFTYDGRSNGAGAGGMRAREGEGLLRGGGARGPLALRTAQPALSAACAESSGLWRWWCATVLGGPQVRSVRQV